MVRTNVTITCQFDIDLEILEVRSDSVDHGKPCQRMKDEEDDR